MPYLRISQRIVFGCALAWPGFVMAGEGAEIQVRRTDAKILYGLIGETKPAPAPNPQALKEIAVREARLAAALRANLKRRKLIPKTDG